MTFDPNDIYTAYDRLEQKILLTGIEFQGWILSRNFSDIKSIKAITYTIGKIANVRGGSHDILTAFSKAGCVQLIYQKGPLGIKTLCKNLGIQVRQSEMIHTKLFIIDQICFLGSWNIGASMTDNLVIRIENPVLVEELISYFNKRWLLLAP